MKNKILALSLFASMSIFAGKDGGNGGGAIVCANDMGITSAKLLDLREAELNGLTILRNDEISLEVQLEKALIKYATIYPQYVQWMREEIALLNSTGVIKKSEGRLSPPTDTGIDRLNEKRSCSLEGVARYNDKIATLELDEVIFENFTNTDKAALYFHEALYRVHRLRVGSVQNSKKVRDITGKVFAQEELEVISPKIDINQAISKCISKNSKDNEFYLIPANDGITYQMHFTKMMGKTLKEKMVMNIGKSFQDGDINSSSFYKKGLRIIRKNSMANGLHYTVGPKLKKSQLKQELKGLFPAIAGNRYISEARYVQEKAMSSHGLPTVVRINTEDNIVLNKGRRIHFNKNIELIVIKKIKGQYEKNTFDKIICNKI